jgi:hypothetical protein
MRVNERCNTEGPLPSWDDGTAKEDAPVGLRSEKELAGLIDDVARRPSGAGGRGRQTTRGEEERVDRREKVVIDFWGAQRSLRAVKAASGR